MPGRIEFKPKKSKIIECILYLAHKGIELDQYKTVKLFYLADREHMRRFGRPVTFDRYVAMENGPVASISYDILKGKRVYGVNRNTLPFEIHKIENICYVENPKRDIKRDIFSKSDLMVMDSISKKFGGWTFRQLYNYTHDHYAYDRAWRSRTSKAEPMRFEDFIEETANKDDMVDDLEFTAKGM